MLVVVGASRPVRGSASLVSEHYFEQQCAKNWELTLRAAVAAGKLDREPENQAAELQVPDASSLYVDSCGWEDCHGVFHRSASLEFQKGCGLISIVYVEGLKSWCMLAEVASSRVRKFFKLSMDFLFQTCSPRWSCYGCFIMFYLWFVAHPAWITEVEPLGFLFEQYCYLRLGDMKGPLLLYICRGSSLHGLWEPVLGRAPGPCVKVYKEVTVSLTGDASTQSSLLLLPGIGSIVLDLLFNYTAADWSCNSGFSSLEAMLCAVRLWKGMQVCSFVCRTWRNTLQPFSSLTKICYHALQIPEISEESCKTFKLPTIPEAVEAITFAARWWNAGLRIPRSMSFKGKAWPAQIAEVQLQTRMSEEEDEFLRGPSAAALNKHAPTFLTFAKKMLQLPLPWRTKPDCRGLTTTTSGGRFVNCALQESLHHGKNNKSSRVLVRDDGEGCMELLSMDGATILPYSGDLSPLLLEGLRLVSISRGWRTSSSKPKKPSEPCDHYLPECCEASPCESCKQDVEGRRRWGYSDLFGGYVLQLTGSGRSASRSR